MRSFQPVLELPALLTPEECDREIARATKLGFQSQQFRGEERIEARTRASTDDPAAADLLWRKVAERLPPLSSFYGDGLRPQPDVDDMSSLTAVGLNERLRYYRYSSGERFAPHVDLSHSAGDLRSFLTLIVYLNDDFEGGETDFFDAIISPKKGAAIAFAHERRHEGRPVFVGQKHVGVDPI